jgi:hypothetical protein
MKVSAMARSSTLASDTSNHNNHPCLLRLKAIDETANDTVFECGNGVTLTVNSPLPHVFCISLRQKTVRSSDVVPRDLDDMREPMELEVTPTSWLWKQDDIQLQLDETGFLLSRHGVTIVKTSDISTAKGAVKGSSIISCDDGFAMTLHTASMGNAHTWPIPAAHLQGSVAVCGLYGGVGALAADGFSCVRDGELTTISTRSPAIDILLVSGTPIETSNQVSLLAGRVVPPSIWAYGLGLAPAVPAKKTKAAKKADTSDVLDPASLAGVLHDAQTLRAQGIAVDVLLPNDEVALDNHGRFALFTNGTALEDMELSKHLAPLRTSKFKLVPRISASMKSAEMMSSEWRSRGLMTEDGDGFLPNIHAGAVVSAMSERLESVFKHGIDAARLVDNPLLESPKQHHLAWKKTVYASSMRWHGEGADRRAITFAKHTLPTRAGTLGVQVEADCSSFAGLAQWLETLLNASNSGTVLLASRLNIENSPPAVLKRLAPLVGLMPICWLSDANTLLSASDDVRAAWKLWTSYRLKLLPYIAGITEESARNGLPALRSMRLAFPRDQQAARFFSHQYMLGPAVLVAPALHDKLETTVWLPAGEKWYHLPSGTKFDGGQAITIPLEADGIAVFGRDGHVLCTGPDVASAPSINTIKPVTDAWLFGLPNVDPCVTGIRVKVMQMQGNAYIKGLEGTKVISTIDYTVSRRGAEVKVVKRR